MLQKSWTSNLKTDPNSLVLVAATWEGCAVKQVSVSYRNAGYANKPDDVGLKVKVQGF